MGVALSKCLGWWQDLVGEELLPEPAESIDPSSSSSSSSSMSPTNYDVFLSFSGTDTRLTFTSHLYHALNQAGIQTFMDEEELKKGEEIAPNLLKAIHESRISIPIFSINYASSKWCLNELVKIMESRENNGQMVLPIFFHVEPRDVRKQTKDFGKKFHQLANGFKDKGTVESWKKALREAGNLKGWDLKSPENRNESKLIQIVVKSVWDELRKTLSDVPENLVGIDSVVEELLDLLNIGCPDVKIIGIWGMGGIGKTTIAETIFHKIHDKFEGKVILEDIREASVQKSLVCLQNRLLSSVLKQEVQSSNSVKEGKLCIKHRLHAKNVLIILDDVDKREQLEALVGRPDWFGLGSRIIITTQDKHVLEVHQVDDIYEAKELDFLPSLELFSKHAFRKDQPPNDFLKLAKDVVRIAGGLPLALKVLGSFLVDKRSPMVWRSTINKLKKIPNKEIQEKLRISYDGLDDLDKEIFLNIACFFIGMDKEYIIDIIDGCGFPTEVGILNLNHRSLLKIGKYNELSMHDQLRDMGRYIVNQESPNEPGERSRLWSREEVLNVLEKRKGTRKVKGLQLQGFHKMIDLRTEAISDMSELRLLQIDDANLVGDFNKLPSELSWLCWKGCPVKSISTYFPLGKLAVLDLSSSKIEHVWNGWYQNKLEMLKVLNLSWCKLLTETPDFSRLPNLEKLYLEGCIGLTELHCSVCDLKTLKNLILSRCSNLNRLPDFLGNLTELELLKLDECKLLFRLPDSIGKMGNLKTLLLDGTSITELPDAVGFLENIENLSANHCKKLVKLPDSMGRMSILRRFSMDETGIVKLPEDFGMLSSLTELNLEGCIQLRELPCGTCNLKSLKILKLSGCSNLNNVEELLGSLKQMEVIELAHCKLPSRSPGWICNMRNLKNLKLDGTNITELHNVGLLENVELLLVRYCKNLVKLPDSMVEMRLLRMLDISGSSIVKLPEDFGMLSSLERLSISNCREFRGFPENLGSLTRLLSLTLEDNSKMGMLPNSLSGLCSLKYLRAQGCNLSEGGIPSDIGKLSSLSLLELGYNNFSSLPEMPTTLEKIDVENCISLKSLPDLSDLKHLSRLNISNCEKLAEIQGIENVKKSLQRLWVSGCSRALVNSVKKSIGQGGLLPQLSYFSFDGSKIPDCFIPLKISSHRIDNFTVEWEIGPTRLWNPEQHQNPITCVLCFVSTKSPEEEVVFLHYDIIDRNGQKLSTETWDSIIVRPSKRHQDHIHMCDCGRAFFYFGSLVKQGVQVLFRIKAYSRQEMELVKEAGVHLVYEETADSTYKRIANAISLSFDDDDDDVGGEASSSTRKRKRFQPFYQDTKRDPSGFEYVEFAEKKLPLKKLPTVRKPKSILNEQTTDTKKFGRYIPKAILEHVAFLVNVEADGNCGFRAVAGQLGMFEDEWRVIRKDLLLELDSHRDFYVELYSRAFENIEAVRNRLIWESDGNTPRDHWMSMPDMGHLIASCYNVVCVFISQQQCLTFLPLRSDPIPVLNRKVVGLVLINENHFLQVVMTPNAPIPPISLSWQRCALDNARGWADGHLVQIRRFLQLDLPKNLALSDEFIDLTDR